MPTYQSFSGADIIATFGETVIGELISVTYSSTREKAPTYTLGYSNPRGVARGKRGIAGSLVFAVFDRNALLEEMRSRGKTRSGGEAGRFYSYTGIDEEGEEDYLESPRPRGDDEFRHERYYQPNAFNELLMRGMENNQDLLVENTDWNPNVKYADQLQPFNITVNAANEMGAKAHFTLVDVDILNEGMGISIEDMAVSQNYTFMARDIIPLHSYGKEDTSRDDEEPADFKQLDNIPRKQGHSYA